MGGCLVLLIINLSLLIMNTGRAGQSCPGGWPNGRVVSSVNYELVFHYY